MTQHLYALLVGIDQYAMRSQVSSLQGCTNDAKAMKAYLEARVASQGTQLHTQLLLNDKATRQAVIDGFREHLQQAKKGDTVLFFYAGHGSQNRAPEEFWPIMPSRLNETLVCYDSRLPGSWDIADKELSAMIAEVGRQNPHIAVVLDCCHSGSGTRSGESAFAKRKTLIDERDRPASSFLLSAQDLEQSKTASIKSSMPAFSRGLALETSGEISGWHLPQGRHILMSACRDTEEASEYQANGKPCGAFSHFLLDTLQKTNSPLTYRDLFNAIAAKTQANVSAQVPQLEASHLEDCDRPFLGGLVEPFPTYFTLTHSPSLGWCINGGAIHGIQPPANNRATELAVFSIEARPADLHQLKGVLAKASVTKIQPELSQIAIEAELDVGSTYKAVITYLPISSLSVVLKGERESVEKLRQTMLTSTAAAAPASYLKEVREVALAKVRVVANSSEYTIERSPPNSRPIAVVENAAQGSASADRVVRLLAHVARWTGFTNLTPPPGNQLPANAVGLQIYYKDRLLETEKIQFEYEQRDGQWHPPSFKAKLINNTSRALYCTLFNLTEDYSISASFFSSGGIWLAARSEVWVTVAEETQLSDLIPTTVPQGLWEQGISEYQDRLKLIASTAEFDPIVLLQSKIADVAVSRDVGAVRAIKTVDQWMTHQRIITTVRPQPAAKASAVEESLQLAY